MRMETGEESAPWIRYMIRTRSARVQRGKSVLPDGIGNEWIQRMCEFQVGQDKLYGLSEDCLDEASIPAALGEVHIVVAYKEENEIRRLEKAIGFSGC